jgi:hypothetical protein
MTTPFDHQKHLELLDEAQRELRRLGRNDLAGAIDRAIAIHYDTQGRIAQAAQQTQRLKRLQDSLYDTVQTLERYVTKEGAPWLEPDNSLYPRRDS